MQYNDLTFGVFLAPFSPLQEDPDQARQPDMELIEYLDELGYNYAWISEDYWSNHEVHAAADSFVTTMTRRTSHITLGIGVTPETGVQSLPGQAPRALVERIRQLVQLGKGRVAFGIRPGIASLDKPKKRAIHRREMLLEAIQQLTPPFDADTLVGKSGRSKPGTARLNLTDDNEPVVPLWIATQVSPAGAGIAGVYGLGLISLAATSPGGFNALPASWEIYERKARENNRSIDRTRWTLAGPVHIAETRQQAFDNICYGLAKWVNCFHELVSLPLIPLGKTADMARELVDSGLAVIGSAEDAITQLSRLQKQSGGFGCFLQMGHQWADQEQTRKSYQLFAEQVAPVFQRHAGQSQ